METVLTSKTDSHHTNLNYQCLLVRLENDPRFHYRVVGNRVVEADWMPTDNDVLELADQLCTRSPSFLPKFLARFRKTRRERCSGRNRIEF